MKITILTCSFYPDPIGVAPLTSELAEDLVNLGHEVTVATVFPHYPQWEIHPEYKGKLWARENWHGAKVLRTWMRVSKKATAVSKMLYYISFTASSILGSVTWDNPDLLLVISPPLSLALTSSFASMFHKCPKVLLVCDLLPDTAIALGMIKNKTFIKLLYNFEKWSYKQFASIVVVSSAFRENLLAKGVPSEKISTIYTWVDTNFMRPLASDNAFRQKNDLAGKFILLYAGNIGLSQGLETALHAAKLLKGNPDIQFVIVGDGTKSADLRRAASDMDLVNVKFLPLQPRPEIPLMYAAANASLVLQRRNVLDINLPGKIQTIMSSGRPIIAATHAGGEPAKVIQQARAGILVEPENAEQLAAAIDSLYRDPALCAALGNSGREYALGRFSRERALRSYVDIFEKLVPRCVRPQISVAAKSAD